MLASRRRLWREFLEALDRVASVTKVRHEG
jgi:hypothetical protein